MDISKVRPTAARITSPHSATFAIPSSLISQFTDPNAAPSSAKARQALLKYHSLLHHANISHASLNALLPDINAHPSPPRALTIVLRQLLASVLHPRFVLFLPALVLHTPAYAVGLLGGWLLGKAEEEETWAQFKAVFGGLGAAGAYAMVTRAIVRGLVADSLGPLARYQKWVPRLLLPGLQSLRTAGRWFFTGNEGIEGNTKAAIGVLSVFYVTSFMLSRWHDYWVGCKLFALRSLVTYSRAPLSQRTIGSKTRLLFCRPCSCSSAVTGSSDFLFR